jgi:hypothetical protein
MWKPWGKNREEGIGDWSTSPGCFERHLLRRLNNPLFPPSKRVVTKQEFRNAKALDERDAAAFRHAFEDHVTEGIGMGGLKRHDYVTDYLKRTLELMERATAIDGSWDEETRVLEAALDGCKQLLNSQTGPEGAATLERAIAFHGLQIHNPFLAQSFREDSPIPKDTEGWLRTLLSEDEETIEHTAEFAGGLGMKIIETARAVLADAVRDGLPPVDARRKLGLLEQGYSKGANITSHSEG